LCIGYSNRAHARPFTVLQVLTVLGYSNSTLTQCTSSIRCSSSMRASESADALRRTQTHRMNRFTGVLMSRRRSTRRTLNPKP
jgi:hypothetical protein